ncbi:MAG: hypothetical protein FD126_2813, partial [Elusimicrobia bacterium]
MGESPRFEFPADPTKARYGPVAHGLKGLVDGLSRGTGLSSSQVVAGLLTAGALSLAVIAAAVVIIARDTGPAKPEPVSDYTPGGPPPPDPAALNADSYGSSPAPTNVLGEGGADYASEPGSGAPPSGASFDGGAGGRTIPLSSFLKLDGKPGRPPASTAATEDGAGDGGQAPDRSWFKPKAWLLKERSMPQTKEAFGGTQKSQQTSSAQSSSEVPGGG